MHNCLSCHAWHNQQFGGQKTMHNFQILAAHANFNSAYFNQYVRNPKSLNPNAQMYANPHLTDDDLDALHAFFKLNRE